MMICHPLFAPSQNTMFWWLVETYMHKLDKAYTITPHTSNKNGEYLEHFLIENGLLCINTQFQKKRGKLWTHTYPSEDRAQLDYMMINKKWINSVQNCEAYHSLEGISTDHHIVSLSIKLSLRANKKKSNIKIAYNWEHLINNGDLQNKHLTQELL